MQESKREMIELSEALERVLALATELSVEVVALEEARGLELLGGDVLCEEAMPAADNSAMDGFALRAADLASTDSLRLTGESLAGKPHEAALPPGACIRVMTGGLIPEGADTVLPVEESSGFEPRADGTVRFEGKPELGQHIRRRGEMRQEGDLLLSAGLRIGASAIGVLAQQGMTEVEVRCRPRVAVLPTGDEVVPISETPEPGQVRNSNAHALFAQIQSAGGCPTFLPVLNDREEDTVERLERALHDHQLVCTIGGVSMGTHDLVRGAFERLGGEAIIESIRIKPGKPTYFGRLRHGEHESFLLGLPGNPASSFTIFALLGAPFIRRMQGDVEAEIRTGRARLVGAPVKKTWRPQVLPGRLRFEGTACVVDHLPTESSADLFALGQADVFFIAEAEQATVEGDEVVWLKLS